MMGINLFKAQCPLPVRQVHWHMPQCTHSGWQVATGIKNLRLQNAAGMPAAESLHENLKSLPPTGARRRMELPVPVEYSGYAMMI